MGDGGTPVPAAMRRVGFWWLVALAAPSGVTTSGDAWIQPLMWFAPGFAIAAVVALRRDAKARARTLLGACAAAGCVAWAAGLTGMFTGGPMSFAGVTAQVGAHAAFTAYVAALAAWTGAVGAEDIARTWRTIAAFASVGLVGLVTQLIVTSIRVAQGEPFTTVEVEGSTGALLLIALFAVTVAPWAWAISASRATRTWFAEGGEPAPAVAPTAPDASQ